MALIPLNAFKSVTRQLTNDLTLIYTTPETISTIVLSATCSNFSTEIVTIVVILEKPTTPPTQFYIIPDIEIPPKDVLSTVAGRLVLEQGDKLYASASVDASVDFVLSLNEAANE